ncbi:DNA-binding transcriptional regulator, LysR family [Sporobacter termitidis DSM 10068]|uniref:DNA-binding transcriptional regulator, LysR family n=1 Tax=Sporobacter termitidis DSM 10068 TaxID=1123282 RepID=A0A1M5ZIH0_9FIRM|nr:LysR family transcriptional regulator [Sporobacter termitidis]SHI23958.1 DNA-binding transcriptional regulator, LysR family [Sporobacter termitidis DSM 10068]
MTSLQLQYFLTVAKYLNFSKAAEHHFTTQPSISRQIALLEKELGFELFTRTKHSVQLTPAGKFIHDEFSLLYQKAAAVLEKARQTSLGIDGKLNIGYLQETNIDIFLPLIKRFTQNYPRIDVSFEGYGFKDLREKLINRALDVAFILNFEVENAPEIEQYAVFRSAGHVVVSVSHPLAGRDALSMEDFKDESFIVASETPSGMDWVLSQCLSSGFYPKKVIKSATSESIIMYVESGFGVAVMDSSTRFYTNPKFRFIEIKGETAKTSVNAAWRKDNTNPSVALFHNLIIKSLEENSAG